MSEHSDKSSKFLNMAHKAVDNRRIINIMKDFRAERVQQCGKQALALKES